MKNNLLRYCAVYGAVLLCACHKPLAIVHCLRPDIPYVTKKGYGYPKHYFYSRLVCFDAACRKKSAWINKQKHVAVKVKVKKKFRKNDPALKDIRPPGDGTGIRFE